MYIRFVIFPGWGRLIFFKTEEQEVVRGGLPVVATLSNLGKRWKVSFDLKPVVLTHGFSVQAMILARATVFHQYCNVVFTSSRAILDGRDYIPPGTAANHELQSGEWNRIEITHEEGENGNFFLSLSVGNRELGKMDVGILEQENFSDVQLYLGSNGHHSLAFTRRLLFIEKS